MNQGSVVGSCLLIRWPCERIRCLGLSPRSPFTRGRCAVPRVRQQAWYPSVNAVPFLNGTLTLALVLALARTPALHDAPSLLSLAK